MSNVPAKLENSAVATGLEKSVFISISKKGNTKECSNYHTIALISHASDGEGNDNPLQFLPGESQGQRSLVGCCPWGHTESDTTDVT